MEPRKLLAAAVIAAFGTSGAIAAGDQKDQDASQSQSGQSQSQSGQSQSEQSQSGSSAASGSSAQGATAAQGVPMIVLVPVTVAAAPQFADGCWARLYDSTNFRGNQLSLVGPVDMPNMRTAFGTDWSGQFDSIAVGPNARLTVYDNENYAEKAANFKSGQKVADLDEKMGTFENISSVKVACTGSAKTARQEQGGAATGSSGSGSSGSGSTEKSGK